MVARLCAGVWLCAVSGVALAAGVPAGGAVTAPAAAGPSVSGAVTFERAFASPSLNGAAPRGLKLSPDGRWLTVLRGRANDREQQDLWGYDRQSGQWKMLVDSTKLSSGRALTEAERMQRERARIGDLKGIVSYHWATDGQSLLVPLDGELFLVALDGTAHRIEGAGADTLNPSLSPKGGYLSFVRDRRLWVLPLKGGAAQAVTPEEPAATVHWGEAEFVAQEEMARMAGSWWSPDDRRIAVERFDDAGVAIVTRAAIGATGTQVYAQPYPAAGTPNAQVSLWVMGADGSGRVRVDLGTDPDIYLARVDWAPDGSALYVQRQDRAQTRLDMLKVDPATGAATLLFSEKARAGHWSNLSDSYRFLRDGSLIWWSERDGFGHLYHYTPGADGGQWRQLTHGEWVVTGLEGVDQKAHRLIFTGTRDDVLAPQVYALDYAHAGATPRRLTDPAYVNAVTVDKSGQTLVITRQAQAQPPQTYLAGADGARLAWVEENAVTGAHPYAPYLAAHRAPTFGTIRADDGTLLHWKMITPVMEPGKRYPVFFEHYGGPHAQVVNRGWTGALAQAIVAKGYIYFELDNRGSPNRGVDFERAIHHAMGSVEVADQLAGARHLASLPFVDPAKIATYGWSYGGYMTLKMLAANPGVYAAGIAGAPVTKWELYDTHYTERYLGDPRVVPQVYARANALEGASNISDPLLLIHGMADDNVVFEHASALIARMQGQAKPFEMMLYPGHTHRVSGPRISVHLWNTIFAFLARHGVTPP
ncbi:S9 family peptidase [Novosphingobium ovatum]|nr:S9 family peptidase [Novosphingobium ovatum]